MFGEELQKYRMRLTPVARGLDAVLFAIVESFATFLVDGDPERLRLCENPDCRWVFYDTFDWRLYNKSLALQQSEGALVLSSLTDGAVLSHANSATPATFTWDMPPSSLQIQRDSLWWSCWWPSLSRRFC